MQRALCIVAVLAAIGASPAAGQWTPEQQAVWEFQRSCQESRAHGELTQWSACFHRDYRGWSAEYPFPVGYNEARAAPSFEANRPVAVELQPLHVFVRGNMAVVHYFAGDIFSEGEPQWFRCTDVLLREAGTWSWIADNCGPAILPPAPSG